MSAGAFEHADVGAEAEERSPLWALATRMTDMVEPYGKEVAKWLYEKMPDLPKDDEVYKALEEHGSANVREVLVTLRAGMSPDAHEAPAEAIAHARFLRGRGLGFRTMVDIYKPGFALFRDLVILELREQARSDEELAEMIATVDAYAFPFVETTLSRLAIEFGVLEDGWVPGPDDDILGDAEAERLAQEIRDRYNREGHWIAPSPEEATARRDAEELLDEFSARLRDEAGEGHFSERVMLAETRVVVTLADEPELSVTLNLDRDPIEVVDGVEEHDARLWIASVDLARIGSKDFHLPMAIAKGRARTQGPIRPLLRVIPVIQGIFAHTNLDGQDNHPGLSEGEDEVVAPPR